MHSVSSSVSTAWHRNSAIAFQPVRSNATVLTLSVSLPPALLAPPLIEIFAAAGVDAHRIQVPVTAAYVSSACFVWIWADARFLVCKRFEISQFVLLRPKILSYLSPSSLDALLRFLRIMHLTATHELIPQPVSTDTASPTSMTPDATNSTESTTSSPLSSSASSASSARPATRSPLEHCVAHLLSAASTATSMPLSLPNELAALRRARQLADQLLRSYATSARSDAVSLFEDRLVALLSAAVAEAKAEAEAEIRVETATRTDRKAHGQTRVEETVADAAVAAETKDAPPSTGSARILPSPATAAAAVADHDDNESEQQQLRRRLATALDAARSARDRLRPLDASMRAAISVRLEEKLALEALRDRVRKRWLRILETGVLHAGGGAESAANDGEDADGEADGDAAGDGAHSGDHDASIPVAPAGFDWCARTLSGR
jgi:hypothetical protein